MDGKKLLKATGKIAGMGLTFMFGMVAQELLRRDDLCMREDWPHTRILKAVADNWRDKTEKRSPRSNPGVSRLSYI